MRSAVRAVAALACTALLSTTAVAQTYSNCNPTLRSDCPPDSALGRTVNIDFSEESDSFSSQGSSISYNSDGVSLSVAKSGDSPTLTSKWYIMFGKVEVVAKAAPGKGIVSSFILISDTLDEIDWEWLGADNAQVQTNYFGKGQTTSYNRGAFHEDPDNQNSFKTYTILWSAEQIVWQIDGTTVRTLEPANADNQYPQSPMQVRFGSWSGGDPANDPGTIEWAQGPTDYSGAPYSMVVKSLLVQDYSTGTQYIYGDQSGTWESIESNGGEINSGGTPVEGAAPAITSSVDGGPRPFTPTETDVNRPSVYPWVPNASESVAPQQTYSNYPGLPSGWTVSDSGKVVPPSAAPSTSQPAQSTPSSAASPLVSSGASNDVEVITGYDQRGFTTIYTVKAGVTAAPRSYDNNGFLAATSQAPAPTAAANADADADALEKNGVEPESESSNSPVPPASSAFRLLANSSLVLLAASIGALSVIL